jgi:hypothetical protein
MNSSRLPLTFSCAALLLTFFAASWGWLYAEGAEIKACANDRGVIYMVGDGFAKTQCAKNEKLISWNVSGAQGPQGEKGDKGDKGEPGEEGRVLHLFDRNDNDLGIYVGFKESINGRTAFVPSLGGIVEYEVNNSPSGQSIALKPAAVLYYLEPDCQGQSYVGDPYSPQIIIKAQGHTRFFKVSADLPQGNVTAKSRLESTGCSNGDAVAHITRVEEVSLPFPYPPAWPLEVRVE